MESYFDKFYSNIQLTSNQKEDALTKYSGVCQKLHSFYYTNTYDGKTKLLIGSYGKRTNIRPARDIDVIFKMPSDCFAQYDDHKSNGQSNLLAKIKSILEEKYPSTTIKAFGKVVVVEFADTYHNVEVVPSFEQADNTFKIPNTENGGSWEIWDPRSEIKIIDDSDTQNNGNTRKLIRMIKKWEENCCVKLKSYEIENAVVDFLDQDDDNFIDTQTLVFDFFEYFVSKIESTQKSHVETALKRARKAIDFFNADKELKAIAEWKKIFGSDFPGQKTIKSENKEDRFYSKTEQFIEQFHPIEFHENYFVKINCYITQDGWRRYLLNNIPFLLKKKKLEFFIESINVPKPYSIKWKVRNFGEEAKLRDDLRGQIWVDLGRGVREENTKYTGSHYVECYIIKENVCVAYDKFTVLIKNGEG